MAVPDQGQHMQHETRWCMSHTGSRGLGQGLPTLAGLHLPSRVSNLAPPGGGIGGGGITFSSPLSSFSSLSLCSHFVMCGDVPTNPDPAAHFCMLLLPLLTLSIGWPLPLVCCCTLFVDFLCACAFTQGKYMLGCMAHGVPDLWK